MIVHIVNPSTEEVVMATVQFLPSSSPASSTQQDLSHLASESYKVRPCLGKKKVRKGTFFFVIKRKKYFTNVKDSLKTETESWR